MSVVPFAIIFSHSEGCLFTLLIVSFAVQKLLNLIMYHFFYFCFYFHYSRRWVIENLALIYYYFFFLLLFMSSNVLPKFSSKSFMVSGL